MHNDPFGRALGEPLVVVVTVPFPPDDELQPMLAEHAEHVEVHFTPYNESRELRASRGAHDGMDPLGLPAPEITTEMKEIWRRAHVVVGIDLPQDIDELAPNLRWFQTVSAGVDQVNLRQLAAMHTRLSSASGIASASIAEFVMARLLGVWKHLRDIDGYQREQRWVESFGTEVGQRTLVIAGLGSIGRELARRARAFDMTVVATRASAQLGDHDPDVDELHPAADLDLLLPRADAVVCALPGSPATVDLFDGDRLRLMKPDAIFCNVGRGTLVVEADLIEVLESGHLRAAILDVMRTEPLPENDPLWTAPRTFLSPHSAVSLDRYQQNGWRIVTDNLGRYMRGERLHNEVDLPILTESS